MACHRTSPARRVATRMLPLVLMLVLLAPLVAGAEEAPAAPLRHWAFGWDPGDSDRGLTVRYRFTPRWDLVPSGELRLHLLRADSSHSIQTWKDAPKRPLEQQINAILLGFLEEALQIKFRRDEQRRREEEDRRQAAIRYRQSQRRAANAKLVHELEIQAGAWYRARILRSYLRALRRATGAQAIPAQLDGSSVDFLSWAEHYLDQLDPLTRIPHDDDLTDESIRQYGDGDGIQQTLGRLLGRYWQATNKVLTPDASTAQTRDKDL